MENLETNVVQPDTTTEVNNTNDVNNVTEPNSQSTEQVANSEPFLKIKYNKEELELDREKAIELAQKGANYDKVYEKLSSLENDPRLSFVEKMATKNGMSVDEYLEAAAEAERQAEIEQLLEQNIPEDIAKELYENRMFREQMLRQQEEAKTERQKQEDYQKFINTFPDVKPEEIHNDVWEQVRNGKSLVDAYMMWDYNNLKNKIQVNNVNAENADKSTGSVTGNGNPTSGFFTREQVKAMSQEDVSKNYDSILESMKQWR